MEEKLKDHMDKKTPVLPPFYSRYVKLVSAVSLPLALQESGAVIQDYASSWTEETANYRYAPEKWTAREVLIHMIDAERVFAYRAMRFSRGDQTELPGFDENNYATQYDADPRDVTAILHEMRSLRESTIAMFSGFSSEMMETTGTASTVQVSVRSIGEIIVGHEMHHLKVLKEKYFPN